MKIIRRLSDILFAFFLILATDRADAITAVQRSLNSQSSSFRAYLQETGGKPFSESYIQLSQTMEVSSKYLDTCLENIFLRKTFEEICLTALKELTQRPLSRSGREILFSFLSRTDGSKSSKKEFLNSLKAGLIKTDPDLDLVHHHTLAIKTLLPIKVFSSLEVKAWKKALNRLFRSEDFRLLINGRAVNNLSQWSPPSGVYQWALVTDTHEPFIRLGTFLQFANESLKNLTPFAENCGSLSEIEFRKFGLIQVEVFASAKCVAKEALVKTPELQHLTKLPESPSLNEGRIHWIWPTLAIVGAGLALGARGKNIQVTAPAFR